jgi:hypothetical protein
MEHIGTFYVHLVYITAIWYVLWQLVTSYVWLSPTFFPVLVSFTKTNLATLRRNQI